MQDAGAKLLNTPDTGLEPGKNRPKAGAKMVLTGVKTAGAGVKMTEAGVIRSATGVKPI